MISVIVPIYNNAPYLEQCLTSILFQTYSDLEIICVNDGSTDESLKILHTIAQKEPRITVLSQENAGVSAARNAGLDVAKGEYIAFVDSDDELEPDMYKMLLNLAVEHQADIAHCGYKKIYQDGTTKDVQGTKKLLVQDSREAIECLLSGKHFVGSPCNKLYKHELFSDVRFDTSLKINEDVLVNVQVFRKAKKIVFLDLPKYHYFERIGSSCSRTDQLRKKQDCVAAAKKMLEVCKDTRLEGICASRLQGALTDLYRTYLLTDTRGTKAVREDIHNKISAVTPLCKNSSFRNEMNYRFMRYLPDLYRIIYTVYDHIRKPNWDL